MTTILTVALAIASLPFPGGLDPWAEFSIKPALRRVTTAVAIGTMPSSTRQAFRYWLRKVVYRKGASEVGSIAWIDSKTCPAVASVLNKMNDITMPVPVSFGSREGRRSFDEIIVDGTTYSLSAPAGYASGQLGTITISSNIGTALGDWVEGSLIALDKCWSKDMPR